MSFAAAPRGCTGSASLGTFRIAVRRPGGGLALPVKSVSTIPPGSHLLWDPAHLSPRLSEKGEVTVILVPAHGDLIALEPHKAGAHAEWALPAVPSVLVLALGPQGLSVNKVKSLVARNEDLVTQLADYAEQTSEVEALVQELANSEDSGKSTDAALKGFSSQYGVSLPKLDSKAPSDQQAALLLRAVLPAANSYDPLAPASSQMQQSVGLAASVAGLFFGNGVGLAAGGTVLISNLKTALFPGTEMRSAFAQAAGADTLALCTKNVTPKSRTRIAYLWAYRAPNLKPPVVAVAGPAHLPVGVKSAVQLKAAEGAAVKDLDRARDWRLVPVAGGPPVSIPAAVRADSLELDLTKVNALPGDYRLTASWDWDPLSLGTVHLHAFADFSTVRIAPESRNRLVEGSGRVAVKLTGADFEFVDKVAIRKASAKSPASPLEFELPVGKRAGDQESMDVEVDTAAPGNYRLVLAQLDGKTHELPLTVLPPNPRISNLPLRVNAGEAEEELHLEGSGLDRIEAISSPAGAITGSAEGKVWTIRPNADLRAGERFPLSIKVKGLEQPLTAQDAVETVGPRPTIVSVRRSMPPNAGVELREDELPAGTTVGMVLSVRGIHTGSHPRLELGCDEGDSKRTLALSPDQTSQGASLTFAGEGELYLSLDAGVVGYAGCVLSATLRTQPEGPSKPIRLGRVMRVPKLEQFNLTAEQVGPAAYAGTLKGRDLDLVEKTGWDAQHGIAVDAIPAPLTGEPGKQSLRVVLPWPAPAPHSPLYVWLRGEAEGRRTPVSY